MQSWTCSCLCWGSVGVPSGLLSSLVSRAGPDVSGPREGATMLLYPSGHLFLISLPVRKEPCYYHLLLPLWDPEVPWPGILMSTLGTGESGEPSALRMPVSLACTSPPPSLCPWGSRGGREGMEWPGAWRLSLTHQQRGLVLCSGIIASTKLPKDAFLWTCAES